MKKKQCQASTGEKIRASGDNGELRVDGDELRGTGGH